MKKLYTILLAVIFIYACEHKIITPINTPVSDCDTTTVTYAVQVKKLMDASCTSCHSVGKSVPYIPLSDYASVKQQTQGKLIKCIKQQPNFNAMPQGASKLSNCQIRTIEKWQELNYPQ
ncbi:MAG: hypothetical protein SGJ10_09795 [Bacteroidota bacterium]|nr:hypothetical protein [Bacteroidota bacterium]